MRVAGFTLVAFVAVLMLIPASASAQVTVGHSGWFWGDPLPQGQDLADVDFTGSRGYAVGAFGAALRTDDAGATWRGLRTRMPVGNLELVQAVDASTVVIGGGCNVRRSTDGGATFTRLPFTSNELFCTEDAVAALDFPDPSIGYLLLANGTVIRTADGGRSFSQRTPLPGTTAAGGPGMGVEDVAFSGPNTGVAVLSSRIYRTTDGGSTWTLATGTTGSLRAIDFADSTTGFVVGSGGVVLRTQDGGATFAARPFAGGGAGQNLVSVDCVTDTTCLMTIDGGDRLARTSDAGATSTAVSPSGPLLKDAAFASSSRAVAVGAGGTTVVSDDAGANFTQIGGRIPGTYSGLRSAFGQRVYSPGSNGRIARTLDGGRSWDVIGVSTSGGIVDVSFPLPATGYALDTGGTLLRTDNAGESWQILTTGASSNPRAVTALGANNVILVGPRGVRRSANGGQSFGAVRSRAVRSASLRDLDRAGNAVFVFGTRAVAVSTNGGSTWRSVRRPRGKIEWVDFVTSRRGYLSTTSGRVYTTANRGRRWREILTGTNSMGQLAFADARRGWISGARDVIRTTDGGRSWQPQNLTNNSISRIAALSGTGAVAQDGGLERLYATVTGGAAGTPSRLSIRPSRRRLRKAGTVRLSGRLTHARGREFINVMQRVGTRWERRIARAASNGTFTVTFRVKRSTYFLAQWNGDDRSAGDGTAPVRVTVKRRKRR